MAVKTHGITVKESVDFSHVQDYQARCAPGVVMVEMAPREETVGILHVPDTLKNKLRADMAVVVGLGGPKKVKSGKRTCIADPNDELSIGDVVVVDHSRGLILQGFGWFDESIARSETRVYGQQGGPQEFHRSYPYWEAVLMKIQDGEITPLGKNVILKYREKEDTTEGGIMLTDQSQKRDPVADVWKVGPKCEYGLEPGTPVLPNKKWFRCCDIENELYEGPEDAILAVYEGS